MVDVVVVVATVVSSGTVTVVVVIEDPGVAVDGAVTTTFAQVHVQ